MQPTIIILPHRSRLLDVLLVSIHTIAAASLLLVVLPVGFRWGVLGLLAVSVWRSLGRPVVTQLSLSGKRVLFCWKNAQPIEARILPDSVVLPFLVVLRLRTENSKRTISTLLLPDQMVGDDFRRVRVCLRWRATGDDRLV